MTDYPSPRDQRGFTMIELLVVIAILAILSGVAVYSVAGSSRSAKEAACETEKAAVITAIEAARVSVDTNGPGADPSDYLDQVIGKYYNWTGTSPDWTLDKLFADPDCASLT